MWSRNKSVGFELPPRAYCADSSGPTSRRVQFHKRERRLGFALSASLSSTYSRRMTANKTAITSPIAMSWRCLSSTESSYQSLCFKELAYPLSSHMQTVVLSMEQHTNVWALSADIKRHFTPSYHPPVKNIYKPACAIRTSKIT
jgi:hypothetical protein